MHVGALEKSVPLLEFFLAIYKERVLSYANTQISIPPLSPTPTQKEKKKKKTQKEVKMK